MEAKKLLKMMMPVILIILLCLAIIVVSRKNLIQKLKNKQQTQTAQNDNGQNSVQYKHGESPSERVEKSIKSEKELYGKVVGIFDPSVGDVRFLTVKADIIDIKKLKGKDLSKGQVELPMIQGKEYKVAVDNNTKFEQGTKEDLKVLDFIQATSVEGIHNVEEFTASYVNVISSSPKSE